MCFKTRRGLSITEASSSEEVAINVIATDRMVLTCQPKQAFCVSLPEHFIARRRTFQLIRKEPNSNFGANNQAK